MVTLATASAERSDPGYAWDFCGGHLAVDFSNTVGDRDGEPDEHFSTYGDVVSWAEAAGLVSRARAAKLRAGAAADPAAARRDHTRAVELREALYAVLASRARGRAPGRADLDRLNAFVGGVFRTAALSPAHGGRLVLETAPGDGLDAVLHPVVRAAVDLLTGTSAVRLGLCADETCAWLFLDTTRSGSRRWCDMKVCGNRNKVRRFRDAAQDSRKMSRVLTKETL